jgi:hypothetical protein
MEISQEALDFYMILADPLKSAKINNIPALIAMELFAHHLIIWDPSTNKHMVKPLPTFESLFQPNKASP